jgi:LemA protein
MDTMSFLILAAFTIAVAYLAYLSSQKVWKAIDTPTIPTGRPVIGRVEMIGDAVADGNGAVLSPFSSTPCAWWSYVVHQGPTYTRSTKGAKFLHSGQSSAGVWIDDGSGPAFVRLGRRGIDGASSETCQHERLPPHLTIRSLSALSFDGGLDETPKVDNALDRPIVDLHNDVRVTEIFVPIGQPMYVFATSTYDETLKRPVLVGGDDVHAGTQKSFRKRAAKFAWVLFALALALALGTGSVAFTVKPNVDAGITGHEAKLTQALLGPAVVLILALTAQIVRIRNRVVVVREQKAAGQSLVDIALKKRAILIPQLNDVVRSAAEHERSTFEAIATDANTASVSAVAEAYPSLRSDANFIHLQNALADIETDVSVARGFVAEADSIYQTRRQSFPDGLIARLTGV